MVVTSDRGLAVVAVGFSLQHSTNGGRVVNSGTHVAELLHVQLCVCPRRVVVGDEKSLHLLSAHRVESKP